MSEEDWTLYRDRPDWSDLEPIPQDDGATPVVAINYSKKFKDAYDYFRGVIAVGEKSERALSLTADCLDLNPSNYSVWQYRRQILKECQFDLNNELEYTLDMIRKSEKNYQVWHHRRVIIEWLKNGNKEDEFTRELLELDPKNYHAWQHRQWYIRTFNLFQNELEYTKEMLDDDIRNNSAWNQRYFVINETTGFEEDVVNCEVIFTINAINRLSENESAWNYLRGLIFHLNQTSNVYKKVVEFCERICETNINSSHAMAFYVDLLIESKDSKNAAKAVQICEKLAYEVDKIRCNYWKYIISTVSSNINSTQT